MGARCSRTAWRTPTAAISSRGRWRSTSATWSAASRSSSPLVEIERPAPDHPDFIRRLARTATDFTPPTGFRGRLTLDDDGRIDLKRGGVVPIANLARFHALQAGVTISSTVGRLHASEAAGALDGDTSPRSSRRSP